MLHALFPVGFVILIVDAQAIEHLCSTRIIGTVSKLLERHASGVDPFSI